MIDERLVWPLAYVGNLKWREIYSGEFTGLMADFHYRMALYSERSITETSINKEQMALIEIQAGSSIIHHPSLQA